MSIREKIMAADGQWLMGRVMPRELLQGIGKYLHRVAPECEDELIVAIRNRAEEFIEANVSTPWSLGGYEEDGVVAALVSSFGASPARGVFHSRESSGRGTTALAGRSCLQRTSSARSVACRPQAAHPRKIQPGRYPVTPASVVAGRKRRNRRSAVHPASKEKPYEKPHERGNRLAQATHLQVDEGFSALQ